jgi:alkaline phosphatase D
MDLRIYRGFDFGELLSLHMLDTRLIARDRQLDYGEFVDPNSGRMDMERLRRELGSLDRRLLGEEQLAWLAGRMAASPARWQLLGQQVLMGRMHFPAELLARRGEPGSTERLAELVALKQRALAREPLSERDRQRLATVAPYNLDAWDGYPAERERLYGLARRLDKRLVSVAGDTHNAWFNRLSDRHGQDVGVELATASVSSPGMERYLDMTAEQARELAQALPVLVDDLQYCNLHQRGFLLMTAYPERLEAEWRFIDTVKSPRYQVAGVHREVFPAAGRA